MKQIELQRYTSRQCDPQGCDIVIDRTSYSGIRYITNIFELTHWLLTAKCYSINNLLTFDLIILFRAVTTNDSNMYVLNINNLTQY